MSKIILAVLFVILLVAAYVSGFVVAISFSSLFGVTDTTLLSIIGFAGGGVAAGEFVSNATSI